MVLNILLASHKLAEGTGTSSHQKFLCPSYRCGGMLEYPSHACPGLRAHSFSTVAFHSRLPAKEGKLQTKPFPVLVPNWNLRDRPEN